MTELHLRGAAPPRRLQDSDEGDTPSDFPSECNWECYLDNYGLVEDRDVPTKEGAFGDWLQNRERDCTCRKFPPSCNWECYLENYPSLEKNWGIPHCEEVAFGDWVVHQQRDCTCKESIKPDEDAVEEIKEAELALSRLDGMDGDLSEEMEDVKEEEETAIEGSFPPGCTWECYLDRYANFHGKIERAEGAALEHWLNNGIREGRDCTCPKEQSTDPTMAEIQSVEEDLIMMDFMDDDSIEMKEQAEELEVLEEGLIEETFPNNCTWECYLQNYEYLSKNSKLHTEEAALDNWLVHGLKTGRDCTCHDEGATDDTAQQIEEVEKQLVALDFQDDDGTQSQIKKLEELEAELVSVKEHSKRMEDRVRYGELGLMVTWIVIAVAPILACLARRWRRYSTFQTVADNESEEANAKDGALA